MTNLSESSIPSFVWTFVKKIVKNPITAGILALIIYNYIKNKDLKKQKESIDDITETEWDNILADYEQSLTEQTQTKFVADNTMDNSQDILATKIIPILKKEEVKSWKDIGGNPKTNKIKRWSNGKDTLYITKKVWPDKTNYGVGINANVLRWFDDLTDAIEYANRRKK